MVKIRTINMVSIFIRLNKVILPGKTWEEERSSVGGGDVELSRARRGVVQTWSIDGRRRTPLPPPPPPPLSSSGS